MKTFTDEPLHTIYAHLKAVLEQASPGAFISIRVCDPDGGAGFYAGEPITVAGETCRLRSIASWATLGQLLGSQLMTPKSDGEGYITLSFRKLHRENSFHTHGADPVEKYGVDSEFIRIVKTEEPAFYHYLALALEKAGVDRRARILELGSNRGDLLELILSMNASCSEHLEFVGIDHCPSATKLARERFNKERFQFLEKDLGAIEELSLDPFDLVISIGTLQSPEVDFHRTLRTVVRDLLTPGGALILGFPNCRWIDGQMVYGARAPNYNYPEMSLVIKDLAWCRRYLAQHRFRVTVTGREYLFLTATPLGR
ncbi:class I SAM-dependent methyltransferase [Myxococcota bacterium]|nr:class I SAM-dependent methyltransferase [Myxococcota bacterium]MBU1534527.1 class I SAM-dependent methyltransferase [Myxococcota bacterium]